MTHLPFTEFQGDETPRARLGDSVPTDAGDATRRTVIAPPPHQVSTANRKMVAKKCAE
jgi:hypothetical protein